MNYRKPANKNRRAGCKMCKPWKARESFTEHKEGEKRSDHARRMAAVDYGEYRGSR